MRTGVCMKRTRTVLYDRDIREPLFDFLEERYGKIRILEEKIIGGARADLIMITPGLLYGIEIKSDADTYTRLKRQTEYYNLFFDRNFLVVGSSHGNHAAEHIPEWWGIITVEEDGDRTDFYVLRDAGVNPEVKPENKITMLWRPELNNILANNMLPAYKYKSKKFVQEYLIKSIPGEKLWPEVCEELFERDYNTIEEKIKEFRRENSLRPRRKRRVKKAAVRRIKNTK